MSSNGVSISAAGVSGASYQMPPTFACERSIMPDGRLSAWLIFPGRRTQFYEDPCPVVFEHACKLGCEGIVSKRRGSRYSCGRSSNWLKVKNPDAPAVRREAEEDWGG
jgi:hypothetical protein